MSGPDVERIAAGLTVAQRGDILRSRETFSGEWQCFSADLRTGKALDRKGITERRDWAGRAYLTPLGLAVRAHLERLAMANEQLIARRIEATRDRAEPMRDAAKERQGRERTQQNDK